MMTVPAIVPDYCLTAGTGTQSLRCDHRMKVQGADDVAVCGKIWRSRDNGRLCAEKESATLYVRDGKVLTFRRHRGE